MFERTHAPHGLVTCYQGQPCTSCNGTGRQTVSDTSGGTYREYSQPCPSCNGNGQR